MPHFLDSSYGVTDVGSEEPDSFDGENLVTSDIDMERKFSIPRKSLYYLRHLHLLQIQRQVNKNLVNQVVVFILTSPKRKKQK